MITCSLRYVIAPYLLAEFEQYARAWIPLVTRCGGQHHGDLLPSERANNSALALFLSRRLPRTSAIGALR